MKTYQRLHVGPQRVLRLLYLLFVLPAFFPPRAYVADPADKFLKSEKLQTVLHSQDWKAVLEAIPDDSTVYGDPRVALLAGHAHYGLGQNNAAAIYFSALVDSMSLSAWERWTASLRRAHDASAVAHFLYGDALARNARVEDALGAFSEAIAMDASFCLAYVARGAAHDIIGNLDAAYDDFQQALDRCPDFADTYVSMGVIYLQRGITPAAGRYFEDALHNDPLHALAHNGRACYYAVIGDIEQAKQDIQRADSLLPNNPYIRVNARALADPSDTTSVLGRIANLDRATESPRAGLINNLARMRLELQLQTQRMQMKIKSQFSIGLDLSKLRKGVYFDIKEDANLRANNTQQRRQFATEYTLAYPRLRAEGLK